MESGQNCILAHGQVRRMADDISRSLVALMRQYTGEVAAEIAQAVEEVGNDAVADLKSNAPRKKGKGGGKYRRSLTMELSKGNGKAGFIAYAKAPYYRLTHLLEDGHRTRLKAGKYGTKARTTAKPHFEPAQKKANQEALRRIEEVLKK